MVLQTVWRAAQKNSWGVASTPPPLTRVKPLNKNITSKICKEVFFSQIPIGIQVIQSRNSDVSCYLHDLTSHTGYHFGVC